MTAPSDVRTVCGYCGVGCGVIAEVSGTGDVSVRGDESHPANFGRLCSKGAALAEMAVALTTLMDADYGNALPQP